MPVTRLTTADLEVKVDHLAKLMRDFVEVKSGFAEDHAKSRTLQNILKQFDLDHNGTATPREFAKVLEYMNIQATEDEQEALFDRCDQHRAGRVSFKDLADAAFGVAAVPFVNPEARAVVRKCVDFAKQRYGDTGVAGLSRGFAVMDRHGDGRLTKEELFNALQRYGVQVSLQDTDILLRHFDRDRSGTVSLSEFQRALRGHMPRARRALVRQAYALLDRNGDQSVTLREVAAAYDVSNHPAVAKRLKTADEVLEEFTAAWNKDGDASLTLAEFLDYYGDLSAAIDDDQYFELMMRNAWHISGGVGSAQNTTCRRVLVTYRGGRQQIEEIENDLGVGAKDIGAMKTALEAQGCRDIIKIELYS